MGLAAEGKPETGGWARGLPRVHPKAQRELRAWGPRSCCCPQAFSPRNFRGCGLPAGAGRGRWRWRCQMGAAWGGHLPQQAAGPGVRCPHTGHSQVPGHWASGGSPALAGGDTSLAGGRPGWTWGRAAQAAEQGGCSWEGHPTGRRPRDQEGPVSCGGSPLPHDLGGKERGASPGGPTSSPDPTGLPCQGHSADPLPSAPPGLLPSFPPPTPTHPQAPRTPPAHAWPGVLTQPSLQSSTPPCSMLRGHRREIEAWSLCPRPPPVSGCAQGLLPKPGTWSCACRSGCRPLGRGPCPRRAPAHPSAGWGNTSPLGWRPCPAVEGLAGHALGLHCH